jgi:hypothetical protein
LYIALTDGVFETGAYGVPSELQNPTILGQGGPSSNAKWCQMDGANAMLS